MSIINDPSSLQREVVNKCIICETNITLEDNKFSRLLGLIEGFSVKRCKTCNLRWLSPRPTQEAYKKIYTNNEYFGGRSAKEDYSALAKDRIPYFKNRIIKIESMMSSKYLRILDIGAATGEFVLEAKKRGHYAEGIEFSNDARSYAKKNYEIELTNQPLDKVESDLYDVIHLNHVFEHLPEPHFSLNQFKRILNKNGLLVLEVPQQIYNDLDRAKRLLMYGQQVKFTAYSLHHTYFFDFINIQKLLHKYDFQLVELSTFNKDKAPLKQINIKNILLRMFLWLADKMHKGGNIIEIFARSKH